MEALEQLNDFLKEDCTYRSSILNLNASENHMSLSAKKILTSNAYDCYDFPPCAGEIFGSWHFSEACHHAKLSAFIADQTQYFLGTRRVDFRPRGGQAAEISILLGLANSGDHVFYVSEHCGGHFGLNYIASKCGISMHDIVFDQHTHLIDIERTLTMMSNVWQASSNKLMLVNQSFIVQSQPWEKIVSAFKAQYPDMVISCDISHLLGLIIGHQLANPLRYGVDIIHGSTHKTFPGPQKAIIAFHSDFNHDDEAKIRHSISPGLQSNSGTAEMMALAYVFCEMRVHAIAYAKSVCEHAQIMAKHLINERINVCGCQFNYTQTHQLWLPMTSEGDAWNVFARLHQTGIRVLPAWLPFENSWGIRLGTNALTRRGLIAEDFLTTAHWIAEVINAKTNIKGLRTKVSALATKYPLTQLKYTL